MHAITGRRAVRRLAAAVVATAASVLLAAGPAGASTVHMAGHRDVGVEYIHGTSTSTANAPVVHLTAMGEVNSSSGTITLGGNGGGGTGTIHFNNGTLTVFHDAGVPDQNQVGCTQSFSVIGSYRVIRGTGAYHGARGHGTYAVLQVAHFKKGKHGCEFNRQPVRALLQFTAAGPLST